MLILARQWGLGSLGKYVVADNQGNINGARFVADVCDCVPLNQSDPWARCGLHRFEHYEGEDGQRS